MYNTKFNPHFFDVPATYSVVLDGVSILATRDYGLGAECCRSWRKNNPRSNPGRIRLTEAWLYR